MERQSEFQEEIGAENAAIEITPEWSPQPILTQREHDDVVKKVQVRPLPSTFLIYSPSYSGSDWKYIILICYL